MGLQVWLPLNGDIQNQGLINGTTEKGTYISFTNGKIGQCATSSSSNNTIRLTSTEFPSMFANGNAYTLTCWVKVTGNANNGWIVKIGSNTCGLWWAKSVARLVWNENDNGKRIASSPIADDYTNWHHIASVIDKTISGNITARHYIDGVLSTENGTTTWDCSSHSQPAGNYIDIYPYNALINDVRIYDHALSSREVKEISKGLVLHYPLAMPGGENLLKNSLTNFPGLWSGSGDGRTLTTQSGVSVPEWGCTDALRVYGMSGASNAVCLLINNSTHGLTVPSTSVSGQKYTPSIYIKNNHQNAISIAFNSMSTSQLINQGEIKKVILKATGDGNHYLQFNISASGVNKEYDFTFWHPKIELGEVCTPWIPATTDSLYSAMGFNDGIEYDVSGYGHNGTKTGAFAYDTDTPKYNTCTVFSGSNHIAVGRLIIKDELTYNWWAYSDNWGGSLGGSMMSSIESGGMGHQNAGSTYLWFICGTGTSSNDYGSGYQMPTPSAGWHMFTETWDGFSFKVYIDGVLKFTDTRYTTKTPVWYSAAYNWLFLGGESSRSATTPSDHFIGKLSDVRIYATALSPEDVRDLYSVAASVADNGTLMTSEVSEL